MRLLNGLIAGASKSNIPVGAPSWVARRRSSSVAPLASADSRASPAPAATPRPPAATRPASPRGPAAKNGRVEPKPSPNLRITESSYPALASNGFLAIPASSLIFSRAAFSVSSGNSALIPVPADSSKLMAPGINPLPNSLMFPPTVGFGLSNSSRSARSFCRRDSISSSWGADCMDCAIRANRWAA